MAVQARETPIKAVDRGGRRVDLAVVMPFVVFIVLYLLIPRLAPDRTLNTLVYMGIYVLLALGLNLLMGYAGQISLGHAAFYGIGAYTSAILTLQPIQREIIPGFGMGLGVMAGAAALMSLTRVHGGKLVGGVAALFALSWISQALHPPPVIVFVIHAVGMAALGWGMKIGWWKSGLAGIVSVASAIISHSFLSGVLDKGGASPWTAMFAGVLVTGLIAYLVGAQILRLKGHFLAMATLGFGIIVKIIFEKWVSVTGGSSDGIYGIPTIAFVDGLPAPLRSFLEALQSVPLPAFVQAHARQAQSGALNPQQQYYYLVWAFVFVALLLSVNIVRSRVGRALRAVHGSQQAAESLGVDTERYKVQVFVLSAVLASVAGSLHAHNAGVGYINPNEFSFPVSVMLVVIVVIGGLASIWGALFGAAVIQLLKNWILTLDQADVNLFGLAIKGLDPIVFGAILVGVMILLPQGVARGLGDTVAGLIRGARSVARRKAGQGS